MENEKRYNVYIIEDETGKAHALIGRDMSERQAEKRVESGLMRINTEKFSVADYKVGTRADQEAMDSLNMPKNYVGD